MIDDYVVQITTLNKHSEGGWLGGLFRKKSSTTQSAASVAGNPYRVCQHLSWCIICKWPDLWFTSAEPFGGIFNGRQATCGGPPQRWHIAQFCLLIAEILKIYVGFGFLDDLSQTSSHHSFNSEFTGGSIHSMIVPLW